MGQRSEGEFIKLNPYLLLAISILFNCISLILAKKGAFMGREFLNTLNKLSSWTHFLTNFYILLGALFFVVGTLAWLLALAKLDLSLAYPAVSISYVIIAIASRYLFNETIFLNRWIGIGIIMVGVFIMFRK